MKTYVIYEEVPHPNGHTNRYYHVGNGDVSLDPKDAKKYNAKNWLEFIVTILQLVIKLLGNKKLKYQQIH